MEPGHAFKRPLKQVRTLDDVRKWEKSEAYVEYLGFVQAISESVVGKKVSDVKDDVSSAPVARLMDLLAALSAYADEIEPEELQQRFGNKAYRTWHKRLTATSVELLRRLLPEELHPAAEELSVYLEDGFGNETRIDYGTGHEMAFVMFLCCLFKVGLLQEGDRAAVGLKVFDSYMSLSRKLQQRYRMEPAGSQGVWALDDYQFVPFIWGSAQLMRNARVKPKSIPDYDIAQMLAKDYHVFACVKYIAEVKTGPFAEHSNQLWNVSAVASWDKVHQGLLKMYRAEVLSKYPVIQHVFFGSLFTLEPAATPVPEIVMGPPRDGSVMGDPTARPSFTHRGQLPAATDACRPPGPDVMPPPTLSVSKDASQPLK